MTLSSPVESLPLSSSSLLAPNPEILRRLRRGIGIGWSGGGIARMLLVLRLEKGFQPELLVLEERRREREREGGGD